MHRAQWPLFAFRIHAQRNRRARAQRRAQQLIRRGSGILATQFRAFVGVELVMTGRDRDRVIRRADARLGVRHGSLQEPTLGASPRQAVSSAKRPNRAGQTWRLGYLPYASARLSYPAHAW